MGVRVIHIAPELPPTVGGVADYTTILSRRLVEVSEETIEPVLVHAGKREAESINVPFPVVDLSGQCSATELASSVQKLARETDHQSLILLEYSGYGYSEYGAPLWLAYALNQIHRSVSVPVTTMFHELYASGSLLTKSFWLSYIQSFVVRLIVRTSSFIITNRPDSAEWLEEVSKKPTHFSPVFSNVGEPECNPPIENRDSYVVVFGGKGKRKIYEEYSQKVKMCMDKIGAKKIIDIGPIPDRLGESVSRLEVEYKGVLKKRKISKHLKRARAGFAYRNPKAFTKSGTLAAYFSHGVPTIVALRENKKSNSSLKKGRHYVTLEEAIRGKKIIKNGKISRIGKKGHEWYKKNAHSKCTAKKILKSTIQF